MPSHSKDCIEMSLCSYNNDSNDNNADSNITERDAYHQIHPNYGRIECINRSCKNCGKDLVLMKLLKANPELESDPNWYDYSQWSWEKKGPKSRKLVLQRQKGTLYEIVCLHHNCKSWHATYFHAIGIMLNFNTCGKT